jgi:hypothetical protein
MISDSHRSKGRIALAVIFVPALIGAAQAHSEQNLRPDVVTFIQRRGSCDQLSNDLKRAALTHVHEIEKAMLSLKCDTVSQDERLLRVQYENDPIVIRSLDAQWVRVVRRLPVRLPARAPTNGDHP